MEREWSKLDKKDALRGCDFIGGIGFQPVKSKGKMTGWKPIPRFFHSLSESAAMPLENADYPAVSAVATTAATGIVQISISMFLVIWKPASVTKRATSIGWQSTM